MTLKQLKATYLNKRVRYCKKGEKCGWQGTVISIFAKQGNRCLVRYDNGVEQSYRLDALHGQQKSWGMHTPYLKLESSITGGNA